jgi:hypothetical protein
VPRRTGAWRERAREALAARQKRLTAGTLRDKLRQGDGETRRAAARAALRKRAASLAAELIPLLGADRAAARTARLALEGLAGTKFASPAAWRGGGATRPVRRAPTARARAGR